MAGALCNAAASLIALILVIAASRRLILSYAAVRLYRPAAAAANAPTIWIVCACRNEARRLPWLIAGLRALQYRGVYRVVLIDDFSDDGSAVLMESARQEHSDLFRIAALTGRQHGKAAALREGLVNVPIEDDDLMLVIDADHRLAPDALDNLANYFASPDVFAVAIEHPVARPERSLVSAYCYLEAAVSEVVTSRGQHGLGLPTKLAGSWACRPTVFSKLYPAGWQMADDTVFTAAVIANGGRIPYAADVAALQDVPDTVSGYLSQHVRWSAGYAGSAKRSVAIRAQDHGILRSLDALATHAGYFERPLLLALLIIAGLGWTLAAKAGGLIAAAVVAWYVVVISVQIAVALRLSGARGRLVATSIASLPMLAIDFMVSIRGAVAGLTGRRIAWTTEHRG